MTELNVENRTTCATASATKPYAMPDETPNPNTYDWHAFRRRSKPRWQAAQPFATPSLLSGEGGPEPASQRGAFCPQGAQLVVDARRHRQPFPKPKTTIQDPTRQSRLAVEHAKGGPTLLRLGLDLGTNSIGWALYRLDDGETPEPVELIAGGVLIHQDGRNPQSRASNAAARREKRGPRRNRDRMLRRRRRVAHLLDALDLLPNSEDERAALRNRDPLQLRSEALDRPLTPHELGRALLAFADRRGFKSNRKADGGEDGKIRQDTGELRRRMTQAGARTLGDFLWRRRKAGKTIRARLGNKLYPDRAMIEHELRAIRDAQSPWHPEIADQDWTELIGALLFQRELRPVERGNCTLIRSEKRAYKAYPVFQQFRIWQEVLNIEAARPGQGFQPLDEAERRRIVAKLKSVKSQRFDQLLPEARVNLATAARTSIDGDQTATLLGAKERFGKRNWAALGLERQQEIVERLLGDEQHDDLVAWLTAEFGLGEQAAAAVASAPLPAGTSHLSKAAIERLLPYMNEEGLPYDKAVAAAGLGHHSDRRGDGKADRLPYYGAVLERDVVGGRGEDEQTDAERGEDGRQTDAERYGRIANPTVHIALGQVRRLFNAITDCYGKPDEVVVELARDLKQSRLERERDMKENRRNRERNERLTEIARRVLGDAEPTAHQMRKLRLWDEQGPPNARVCPFTGETLPIGRVLSDETEIEHILPFSRSLDDSMANTVLSMRAANREKGRKTPYEAWGSDHRRYAEILARAAALPPNKQWRFGENAMERLAEQGGFLGRQLNDTRYLSRVTRIYLQAAVHPDRVRVTPGRLTAMLRRAWGLNSLLSDADQKERSDHRHHLIDAAVIGMTSQSLLQKVAQDSARAVDDLGERVAKAVDDPWEGFRDDVKALVERVVVRHRPNHFTVLGGKQQRRRAGRDVTSGGLHKDTAYGIVDGPDAQGMFTLVETKTLASLDATKGPNALEAIRDLALRERLLELWQRMEAGEGKPTEKWQRFADHAQQRYGVRRVRVLLRMNEDSLAFIRDRSGRVYKAYKTDGNAFMDIWLLPNGKTTGETVTRFHAHQPDFRSKIKAEHPTAKKLMRLHINDMIAIGEGEERRILRVKDLTGQRITAVDHRQGGKAHDLSAYRKSAGQVIQAGLRMVSVDVLGRVRDGGPRGPDGRGRG